MADDELATRAPESDLAEQIDIPGDSIVDQGPSLGVSIKRVDTIATKLTAMKNQEAQVHEAGQATSTSQTPTGEITKFNDIDCYITKPADYPHAPCKLLLFLTGGTGIHAPANKLQADAYAEQGYLVIVPDQFNNDPAPNAVFSAGDNNTSFLESLKLRAAEVAKSFRLDMWLARHTPSSVLPRLSKVLSAVKDEFADAVQAGGGVYCVGVSVGGRHALLLASELGADVLEGQKEVSEEAAGKVEEGMIRRGPDVKAAVILHGATIEREDFTGVKSPIALLTVDEDALFSDEVREAGVKSLKEKGVEVQEWTYPGVPHGFAVVGEYQDEAIKQAQKQAFEVVLEWLKAH
ncbi:dienelactone hydrolase [Aureobasidium sp. EXF-8845]|nr:dienelactone hydrolase [Aureobasidium sp. EXF-8845]KAI4855400.1 dienelactone hydrolase [Aureobasidium sp. EXF-8846]